MTPALAARFRADPLSAPRLSARSHPQGWAIWAAVAGFELAPAPEQPFAHVHYALDAALAGLGVAIMSWALGGGRDSPSAASWPPSASAAPKAPSPSSPPRARKAAPSRPSANGSSSKAN